MKNEKLARMHNHNKSKIDTLFNKAFSNSEIKPSARLWENIEKRVLLEERKKKKKRIAYLARWGAGLFLLLLISTGSWLWFNSKDAVVNGYNPDLNIKEKITVITANKETPENTNAINNTGIITENNHVQKIISIDKNEKYSSHDRKVNTPAASKAFPQKTEQSPEVLAKKRNKAIYDLASNNNANQLEGDELNHVEVNNKVHIPGEIDITEVVQQHILNDSLILKNEVPISNDSIAVEKQNSLLLIYTDSAQKSAYSFNEDIKTLNHGIFPQWCLGVSYSPDYTYQVFKIGDSLLNRVSPSVQINSQQQYRYVESSKPLYSYSFGIQGGCLVNARWSFQTGLHYSSKGEKMMIAVIDSTPSGGFSFTATSSPVTPVVTKTEQQVIYQYKFVDIPVFLRYKTGNSGKISSVTSAGVSLNFFQGYSAVLISDSINNQNQEAPPDVSYLRKMGYSILISTGIEYKITSKISLGGEPVFSYSLTPLRHNSSAKIYPYSFGLAISLRLYM